MIKVKESSNINFVCFLKHSLLRDAFMSVKNTTEGFSLRSGITSTLNRTEA